MIDISVNLHGLSDLEQALRDISNDNSIAGAKVIRSALMSASLPMYRHLQATAPKSKDPRPRQRKTRKGGTVEILPGFLRSRIRRRSYINKTGYGNRNIGRTPDEANGLVKVRIGAYTPYAHYVELGTEHSPAQPFMRSAIDGHWSGITRNFRTLLERRLLSYRRRQAKRHAP
ncbi:HK97-gp10 family putative phage morphogenesis protein [Endozoicomonas sp. YOMI1]|uniref:HK97-gp10 family putative phage morphogenesis protein n=1 Tax=Endozoicomonas sp. YOMI1 TaxID=2828739 RepID=UPI00214817C7|nr:HK97-gp10 family putative phage morphogenesis protein [Endozoicomonas sp. YOMI1]